MIFKYTILFVDNVADTLDFYTEAFGFERLFMHEAGDYGELSTGSTKLAFASFELMRQQQKNPQKPSATNPSFELAFETSDVATDLARALKAGANLIQEAKEQPWGQTTSYVSDPNGYLIEICSPVQ